VDETQSPEPEETGTPQRRSDRRRAAGGRGFWRTVWGRILAVVLVLAALSVLSMFVAARFTESNKFCGTDCHEMWPYRDTWQASTHKNVDCVTCHIPPGTINFLKTKLYATREVWVHFTGQVKAPIAVTRHIPNAVCEGSGCHSSAQLAKSVSLGSPAPVAFNHSGHTKQHCIDCHSQVVHKNVPGVAFVPPNSMAACFTCHNDGTKNCSYCHKAPHADRGPCQDCHNLWAWVGGKNFQHPQPLVGTHAQIACEQCHTQGVAVKPDGCIDCHGDQHNGLKNCDQCHVLAHWTPSTFRHPQEGPHVPAGDEPLQCNACHTKGFASASCPCHGGKPPSGGN